MIRPFVRLLEENRYGIASTQENFKPSSVATWRKVSAGGTLLEKGNGSFVIAEYHEQGSSLDFSHILMVDLRLPICMTATVLNLGDPSAVTHIAVSHESSVLTPGCCRHNDGVQFAS
jgi:hypothetical protein